MLYKDNSHKNTVILDALMLKFLMKLIVINTSVQKQNKTTIKPLKGLKLFFFIVYIGLT